MIFGVKFCRLPRYVPPKKDTYMNLFFIAIHCYYRRRFLLLGKRSTWYVYSMEDCVCALVLSLRIRVLELNRAVCYRIVKLDRKTSYTATCTPRGEDL